MRIIANNVEYYDFMRVRVFPFSSPSQTPSPSSSTNALAPELHTNISLRDSLWFFDGSQVHCWMDAVELLQSSTLDNSGEIEPTVVISTDFYPSSIVFEKGVVLGIEAELSQRRDISFALFRVDIRVSIKSLEYLLVHRLTI